MGKLRLPGGQVSQHFPAVWLAAIGSGQRGGGQLTT